MWLNSLHESDKEGFEPWTIEVFGGWCFVVGQFLYNLGLIEGKCVLELAGSFMVCFFIAKNTLTIS